MYYFALFAIIFIIRFSKVRQQMNGYNPPWKEYFLIAQEVLYTAAGIVILLLNTLDNFREGIFGLYLLFVIATASIDNITNERNKELRGYYNFGVLVIVLFASILTFVSLLPNAKEDQTKSNEKMPDTTVTYMYAIPYVDHTLRLHIGTDRFKNRKLMFYTVFTSKNDSLAKIKALENFNNNEEITKPLFNNTKLLEQLISIDDEHIVVSKEIRVNYK